MKRKKYFEGWYFKHQNEQETLAMIVGFQRSGSQQSAFIQIVTSKYSKNIDYPIEVFHYDSNNFIIQLGDNCFSKEGIHLNIETPDFKIKADISYGPFSPIKSDIMGPFRFLPFMECRHGIISINHSVTGQVVINDEMILFTNGKGYIEKDFGHSFPKRYVWSQCNQFLDDQLSIVIAAATIKYLGICFKGCLSYIVYRDHVYRLATYTGCHIKKMDRTGVIIQSHQYKFIVQSLSSKNQPLLAPTIGQMIRVIEESPIGVVKYQLFQKGQLVFDVTSEYASFESVVSEKYIKQDNTDLIK